MEMKDGIFRAYSQWQERHQCGNGDNDITATQVEKEKKKERHHTFNLLNVVLLS